MSSDTITLLVKFLPTILAVLLILLCMLRGLLRGFRKSTILFIHYLIGIGIGLVCYFSTLKLILSNELNPILSSIGSEFSEANSLYDVAGILLNSYLPDFAGIFGNQYMEQFVMAFVGLGISLVLGIVCLVVIPIIIRTILRLLYLLFYREGKIKKHKKAEGEDYRPHRLLGMVVGAVRGVVWSVLVVSFVTSFYFILSGGITHTEEETKEVQVLDYLSETINFDLNAVYKGIKESRSTGVGLLFDLIKIEEKPLDLYYTDLFLSSTFTSYPKNEEEISPIFAYLSTDEAMKGELSKLCIREELALLVGLVENILETNAVQIEGEQVTVDYNKFEQEIVQLVDDYVNGSTLLSDLTPLAIVGIAQAISEDKFSTGEESIDAIFDEQTVEDIKNINIIQDISKILKIAVKAIELMPINEETGQFDLEAFTEINTFFEFDTNLVKDIFAEFGQIDTLTKVVFPVGVGFALSTFEEDILAAGMDVSELQLSDIDWGFELANLGIVYEKVVELDLDINSIFNTNVNGNTGLSYQMEYLISLCSDEVVAPVFKENLLNLFDTIFDSELLSQISLVFIKSQVATLDLTMDDNSTALIDCLDNVKENLKHYEVEHLRADLHELVSSCLDVTTIIPLFMSGEEQDIFAIMEQLNTDSIKKSLIGTYNEEAQKYEGGIYNLRLLSGDLDGVNGVDEGCKFVTDSFVEAFLSMYAAELIPAEAIDSVTSIEDEDGNLIKVDPTDPRYNFNAWPNELAALIDAIADIKTVEGLADISLGEDQDFTEILPESITDEDIDIITKAASKSILLSEILTSLVTSSLEGDEMLGEVVSDPTISWMDTLDEDGDVVSYGEFNCLLKAFRIFTDDEKGIDLNDTDSLINGLAMLIHEASEEDLNDEAKKADLLYGLDYEEVICFASSQVIMTLLSGEVSKLGGGESSDELALVIPDSLNTEGEENAENWKNWAHDENGDRKKGEFAKLVLVLYYAREYAVANPSEVVALAEGNDAPALKMDNLLNSVIYMEKDDKVTDSLVLYATVSDALMKQHNDTASEGETGSIIFVPEKAKNISSEHGIEIIDTEIQKLFVVVRNLEIVLLDNQFDDINLKFILDKLGEEEVRESICVSSIFAASTVNKVAETDVISVPLAYQKKVSNNNYVVNLEHPVWYPSEEAAWDECELNKMLVSVNELGIDVRYETSNGTTMEKLDFDQDKLTELIKELNSDEDNNGETTLDVVYKSAVFRTTISDEIFKQEDILYRENALFTEEFAVRVESDKANSNFSKKEIADLVTFLNKTEMDFGGDDGFDTDKIFDSLKDESIRQLITESNVLNIIVVDKLADADGIKIPDKFTTARQVDPYKDAWYPALDNPETLEDEAISWDESELGMLLAAVVELDIQIENGTPKFPEDETELLKALNEESLTASKEAELTKLDVVYYSDIIKATIKDKLDSNTTILKRDEAYEQTAERYYHKHEIKLLVEFANNDGISFDDFSTAIVFELLKQENNRRIITQSNILNITVVDKFDGVEGLTFPDKFLLAKDNPNTPENEQKINKAEASWYPNENTLWTSTELARLLTSVVELNIKVENDVPVIPDSDVLLKSLNDEATTKAGIRLDVVYESEIIQTTISSKVKQDGIEIRTEAFIKDENQNPTDILCSNEILILIDFVEFSNIEIHDNGHNVDAEHIFSILEDPTLVKTEDGFKTKGEIARKMIVTSNILNMTIVSKLTSTKDIIFPESYVISHDNPITTEFDREIDITLSNWYPQTEEEWDNCELSHFLLSVTELNLAANGNDISFSTNEIIDSLLTKSVTSANEEDVKLDMVYHSDLIAMTISKRLKEFADVPKYRYLDSASIFDVNGQSRVDIDEIIIEEEIELLLIGLKALGLQFAGSDLKSSDVENIDLGSLVNNIDDVLHSAILHYIISEKLIDQNQVVGSESNGIVVYNYWTNTTEADIEVVKKIGVGNYKDSEVYIYVHINQISEAIEVLDMIGINKIEDISNMNSVDKIAEYFAKALSKNISKEEVINNIAESAITCKIFSQIFLSQPLIGTLYEAKPVVEVNDNGNVNALTIEDLRIILNY